MFEEIIEFDMKKIDDMNLDIDKINAYLDEIHLCAPDITKKADGHYVGIDSPKEFIHFGTPIMTLAEQRWFREIVKRWEFWEKGELESDIIETLERRERADGKRLYE